MQDEIDITAYCSCHDIEWHGCYGSGAKYNRYTIPESVKHPAKMSWELLERIFKHLESLNLLTPDSVVIDFMSGTGRTNTMAALRRYRTISVELEPHFIEMIAGYDCDGKTISDFRIEPTPCGSEILHREHKIRTGLFEVECSGNPVIYPVCRCGDKPRHKEHHIPGSRELLEQVTGRKVEWDVIQGDARELSKLLDESGLVGVVSPPYASQVAFQDKDFMIKSAEERSRRMREGIAGGHFGSPEALKRYAEKIMETYSLDPHNIGNLPDVPLVGIMSPPFLEAQTGGGIAIKGYEGKYYYDQGNPDRVGERCGYVKARQGTSEGQIGNLPDKPLVGITSPPYVIDNKNVCHTREGKTLAEYDLRRGFPPTAHQTTDYSTNPLNIGNQQGESYLSAMFRVYQQAFICGISPLVVVTKNPTRNGKLRRLDLDTISLLQLCGYEIFDYHRAVLFESHKQETLSGDTKDMHKGRISFFKRLSLEKGTTVAQFEDVIFARIP